MHADIEFGDRYASSAWQTDAHLFRTPTPPRLHAVEPLAEQANPRLTIADLRLPADIVRSRAAQYTAFARERGAQHSMRLWRVGYQQALLSLAREAVHVNEDAPCLAFFWEQQGRAYKVSATFGQSQAPRIH